MPRELITRAECAAIEKAHDEKFEAINIMLTEISKDIKTVLAWQNQFKGGWKFLAILITISGGIFGALKIFRH
jgi:hypothetical protein